MNSYLTILTAEDSVETARVAELFHSGTPEPRDVDHVLHVSAMDNALALENVIHYRCRSMRGSGRVLRVDFVGHAKQREGAVYGYRGNNRGDLVLGERVGERGRETVGLALLRAVAVAGHPNLVVRFILCDGKRFSETFLAEALSTVQDCFPEGQSVSLLYTPEAVSVNRRSFGPGGFHATSLLVPFRRP